MRNDRVAAVVVTYNRLPMLQMCIAKLEAQTEPCDILVVNNASSDGTTEWLAGREKDNTRLHARDTGANLGGAGGFNFGMRWAVEAGYEYLWVMDDDCLPEPDALEKLLEADALLGGEYGWLSSRCLWTDGELCPMNVQMRSPYRAIKGFDQAFVPAQMASFVSLFLIAETVKSYGLPIAEFVIWTDDWEYTRRISREMECYAVRDSVVVHAMKKKTVVNIATDTPERLNRYIYFYRNDVVLYRREGLKGYLWLLAKDCWHALQAVKAGHPERIGTIVSGFRQGIRFFPAVDEVETNEAK